MKTIKVNPEFAHELVLAIPYAYWLHKQNKLERVITSKDMKSFYYFCNDVREEYSYRTIDHESSGLTELPNSWIHHNSEKIVGKSLNELSEEEQSKIHGVLDYTKWTPPPYKTYYSGLKIFDKPYIIVNNNYNIEFGNPIDKSLRFFDIKTLYEIFNYLTGRGYYVIYKRPNNTEFTLDQNEMGTLQGKFSLSANVEGLGEISDYDLCNYYNGKVINLNELKNNYTQYSYNEFQLRLFSEASGFVTTNGGGAMLCAYFGKPVIVYVPHGKELRKNYLTNKDCYFKKLSNCDVHPVLDPGDINNYYKVIKKIKEIF